MLTTIFIVSQALIISSALLGATLFVKKHRRSLYFLTPVLLAAAISSAVTIKEIQAQPIVGYPELEFVMIQYQQDGDDIYLWAVEEGREFPRTWIFPFSKEMEKSLAKLQSMAEKGIPTSAKHKKDATMSGGGTMSIIGSPKSMTRDNTGGKEGFGKL